MAKRTQASARADSDLPSDGGETVVMLVVAGRRLRERIDDSLAAIGMTMRHVSALGHLSRQDDLSYSDLARRSGITAQSMRATVAQLQQLEAITAITAGQGQRARLELTPTGHELLQQAKRTIADTETEILGHLDDDTRTMLRRILPSVIAQTTDTRPPPPFATPKL